MLTEFDHAVIAYARELGVESKTVYARIDVLNLGYRDRLTERQLLAALEFVKASDDAMGRAAGPGRVVRLLLVAEIAVEPGQTAETVLDAFREGVLPGENWGVTLSQATPVDVGELASEVRMTFTGSGDGEARGEVTIKRHDGCLGPAILVNGCGVGYVDLTVSPPKFYVNHLTGYDPLVTIEVDGPRDLTVRVMEQTIRIPIDDI